jgi:hypothetical protein
VLSFSIKFDLKKDKNSLIDLIMAFGLNGDDTFLAFGIPN